MTTGSGCAGDHEEHPCVCLQVHVQPQQPGNTPLRGFDSVVKHLTADPGIVRVRSPLTPT